MKKNYSRPQTDICEMQVESLMLSVSQNGGGGGGDAHAPKRPGEDICF